MQQVVRRIWRLLVVAALFAAAPAGARAEGSSDPVADSNSIPSVSLKCTARPLPVRAFEINLLRITCQVTGAAAGDTSFGVGLVAADDTAGLAGTALQPLCTAGLSDGAGECTLLARDGASVMQGGLILVARLDPSGTLVTSPPPAAASAWPDNT